MIFQYDYNRKVNVYRRNQATKSNSANVNVFNEPVYGNVTTAWQLLAASLPVLFDEVNSPVRYLPAGERPIPDYIVYAPYSASIVEEDRVMDLAPGGSASLYSTY